MSTTAILERTVHASARVSPDGLLNGVQRPCPEHRHDGACVAQTDSGRLVFWCARGGHHFTAPRQ